MDPELSWRRVALLVTVTTGSVYALLVVSLYMSQRALLFPRPEPVALPEAPRLSRTELTVDGAPVPMWWNVIPEAPLVLFFHGNATQLASTLTQANGALIVGLSFAAVEYPGYGLAPAKEPSEAGCFAAGGAAIAALADLGLGVPVCMGHSLGSGVAAAMAAEGRCRALVLAAPFTSVGDVGAREYPWVPVRLLSCSTEKRGPRSRPLRGVSTASRRPPALLDAGSLRTDGAAVRTRHPHIAARSGARDDTSAGARPPRHRLLQ